MGVLDRVGIGARDAPIDIGVRHATSAAIEQRLHTHVSRLVLSAVGEQIVNV